MTPLIDAKAVATLLSVSVQRVYELTRQNKIPHIVVGARQYRYSLPALRRLAGEVISDNHTESHEHEFFPVDITAVHNKQENGPFSKTIWNDPKDGVND